MRRRWCCVQPRPVVSIVVRAELPAPITSWPPGGSEGTTVHYTPLHLSQGKQKQTNNLVLHQPSAMEDFNKIGLLDFQSKNGLSGIIPSAFNSFSQNTGFLPFKEPALPRVNQNTALEGLEDSKNLQR